jgi:hypothetical protein
VKNLKPIVIIAAIFFALFFLWPRLFPNERAKIMSLLSEAEALAILSDEEPAFQAQVKAKKISEKLTSDFSGEAQIDGREKFIISSKNEVATQLAGAFYLLRPFVTELEQIEIHVLPGSREADGRFRALIRHSSGAPVFETADFILHFSKVDGDWLVQSARVEISAPQK